MSSSSIFTYRFTKFYVKYNLMCKMANELYIEFKKQYENNSNENNTKDKLDKIKIFLDKYYKCLSVLKRLKDFDKTDEISYPIELCYKDGMKTFNNKLEIIDFLRIYENDILCSLNEVKEFL